MKKIFLTFFSAIWTVMIFAQKATPEVTQNVNPALSSVQKAAIEWVKQYDLSANQAQEALAIQQEKFRNLSEIEPLKAQNTDLYIQKRLSSFDIANNELMSILDERQLKIFKQKELERTVKYENIVSTMKKMGYAQETIKQKLIETEF